ncbi:MAG TPA: hypothetical protein VF787_16170 [Thermoanaerobaculia bacterium]
MNESTSVRVPIAVAISAALVRLLPLHFLHPLNWDEIEFFSATKWIGQGLVPFRDFWEHHAPLMWFVFAPVTRLTDSPGVDAIIALRWAQVPVWIATFWLLNLWMRNASLSRFARWTAMAIALCSSLFMTPAVEYRVESLGCLFVVLGLVLARRERWFFAGAAFCLAGFTNLRLGPVLVVAVLSLLVMRRLRATPIVAGGFAALLACLSYFVVTGALDDLWKQVWVENLAEKYATPVAGGFIHRLMVPFGVRMLASDRLFELAAVDVGGILVLLLGIAGLVHAFRRGGDLRLIAILQVANIAFVAFMKFIYNYHFALVVILMVPLLAAIVERMPKREVVFAIVIAAWAVNLFAAVFRGKELDLAYQDVIMREAHAHTRPGDAVWSGIPWAIRRDPAYRFWFLPELARILVRNGEYRGVDLTNAPAAVVFDHNALRWVLTVQRDLEPALVRNYIPVWRELWVPAMNASIPARGSATWTVPRDGSYRVYVSQGLARHPWFRAPLRVASHKGADASRLTARLPNPGAGPIVLDANVATLRKGQRVTASNPTDVDLAVILMSTDDRVLFKQPPPGVSLEAETTRITHWPAFR